MRRSRQRGLRFKLAIGISLTLIILLGVIFVFVSQFIRNQLWQREVQTAENLNAMAEAMIVDAMMEGNKSTINNSLNTLGRSIGGRIDSISIYDDQSTLTSFATGFPGGRVVPRDRVEITPADPGCLECHQEPAQSRPAYTTINIDGVDLIRNVIPLYNDSRCQTCHGTGQKVLGDSIVDIRLDQYESASTTITIGLGSSFVGAIVLVGIVMNNLIGGIVINPLDDLVKVTETIFEGDLNKEATIRSKDEVGRLGEAFNRMTSQLRETLRDLEHRVRDRTKELEVRSTQLQAAADVGRAASMWLN
jgi:HAMP domain-containing protein